MLQFGLAFLLISPGIALAGLALLHLLLHLGELRVELPNDVLLLLLLQLVHAVGDVVNLLENLLLKFLVDVRVLNARILLETKTNAQLVLQLVYGLSVLQFALAVTFFSSAEVLLDFLVLIHLRV